MSFHFPEGKTVIKRPNLNDSLKNGKNDKSCWCKIFLPVKIFLIADMVVCFDDEIVEKNVTQNEHCGEDDEDELVEIQIVLNQYFLQSCLLAVHLSNGKH